MASTQGKLSDDAENLLSRFITFSNNCEQALKNAALANPVNAAKSAKMAQVLQAATAKVVDLSVNVNNSAHHATSPSVPNGR